MVLANMIHSIPHSFLRLRITSYACHTPTYTRTHREYKSSVLLLVSIRSLYSVNKSTKLTRNMFSQSSVEMVLDGSVLKAKCKDLNDVFQPSDINLNSCIANLEGKLEWALGGNFAASSSNLQFCGTATLQAMCQTSSGSEVPATINLDQSIANIEAHLIFARDTPGGFSLTSRNIRLSGTELQAQCKAEDGSYKDSSLDLNKYIGNIEGCLEWKYAGFADSSKDISLSGSSYLLATCQTSQGTFYNSAINLDEQIVNINGQLQIQQ